MRWNTVDYPRMPQAAKWRRSGNEGMARLPEKCMLRIHIAALKREDSANMTSAHDGTFGVTLWFMGLPCVTALPTVGVKLLERAILLQSQIFKCRERLVIRFAWRSVARTGAAGALCQTYAVCTDDSAYQSHMALPFCHVYLRRKIHQIYTANHRGAMRSFGQICRSDMERKFGLLECAGLHNPVVVRWGALVPAQGVYT